MLNKIQKKKKIINYLLTLLLISLIFFFSGTETVYASDNNWVEVSRIQEGIQYVDRDSLINKEKGIIEITTKYIKINPITSEEDEENFYIMKINCLTNKFKDISVNGKKNLSAKWEGPNGDKLINDVILNSCKNV